MVRTLVTLVVLATVLVQAEAQTPQFRLSSPAFRPGGTVKIEQVFNGFGCTGGNISPELSWSNAPAGTKSFAVTMYDPDAPTGSGWWHWVIFNIPANVTKLAAGSGDPGKNSAPPGSIQSRTDFGTAGYGGPCPPAGHKPHRYIFTVFALKVDKLDADANASGAMAGFFLNANALGKASITARYGR